REAQRRIGALRRVERLGRGLRARVLRQRGDGDSHEAERRLRDVALALEPLAHDRHFSKRAVHLVLRRDHEAAARLLRLAREYRERLLVGALLLRQLGRGALALRDRFLADLEERRDGVLVAEARVALHRGRARLPTALGEDDLAKSVDLGTPAL